MLSDCSVGVRLSEVSRWVDGSLRLSPTTGKPKVYLEVYFAAIGEARSHRPLPGIYCRICFPASHIG